MTTVFKPIHTSLLICLFCLIFSLQHTYAQDKRTYQSLQHALFSSGQLTGDQGPKNVQWISDGYRYSYLERNLQHFAPEIRVRNLTTGEDTLLFHPAEHSFPHTSMPFYFEDYKWSEDESSILFKTNFSPVYRYSGSAEYYHYDVDSKEITHIAHQAFNAQISPDGNKVGFHKNGEMFIHNLETGEEIQLTHSSEKHLFNGRFAWVYEEVFKKTKAWKWSKDSRHIAFWQTDERNVKLLNSSNYEGVHPTYNTIPFPKAGDNNPEVKIGIINIETGNKQWIELDSKNGLIPRIYWTANPEELAVVWMNREQNHMRLYFYNVNSEEKRLVLEESYETGWIDIYNYFTTANDYLFFPGNMNEFFWISDRTGFNHIFRYDYDGNLINQITDGDWEVTELLEINSQEEVIYYASTEKSPLERHLYSIRFDGSEKVQISKNSGRHEFNVSPNGKFYIDRWSNTQTPLRVDLRTTQNGGDLIEVLGDNSSVITYLEQYAYQPREMFSFTSLNGTKLDGYLIRPHNFDPDKSYPLVLMVYGGPGSQGVYNEFETSTWVQYLAQQGYVIANINNRGSSGYGRDFKKAVHKKLGVLESEDYATTARYLSRRSWIDENRIAIRGHSYGGFMAALTAVLHPTTFKVSLVGAPVTDWRLYNSIFSERYMGFPDENEENYRYSSVMHHAGRLRANMLIAHSSMDEIVHIQNTMQLITALTEAGKDVDLRIYPKGDHSIAYNEQSHLLLYKVYTDYLERHLK